MCLDEQSSYLTTFSTPFGRYRYLRLPYGISSAPEVYHRTVKDIFGNMPGVDTSIDDVVIAAENTLQHDEILEQVLERARQSNLKLNKEKCEFGVSELVFLGDVIGAAGIRPDPKKVSAIVNMDAPKDKAGVLRFMGMISYLSKWIPDMASHAEPLRNLTKKNVHFEWQGEHDKAFQVLKKSLINKPILGYYKPQCPLKLSCDANKNGVGCCLMMFDNNQWQPLGYFSRQMLDAETRYAMIEKELLAIAFGCARCHQYIYGTKVLVETDHKSLIPLFKKPLSDCPLRVQKMLMRLQRYSLDVQYVPGKKMVVPDTLSRATEKSEFQSDRDLVRDVQLYVNTVLKTLQFSDSRLEQVKYETSQDDELKVLMDTVISGWPENKEQCSPLLYPYWNIRAELSVANGIIFKGTKVVIPKGMRSRMLKKVHEGHMGAVKSKSRAREVIYWPGMSGDIDNLTASCSTCMKFSQKNQHDPLQPHEIPLRPWMKLGTDLFHYRGNNYLIMIDYYSNFPEMVTLRDISADSVVNGTKSILARHGVPDVITSDGGGCYTSAKYKSFVDDWEIKHVVTSSYMSNSNGQAESCVKIVKNILKKSIDSGSDLFKDLLAYRTTPLKSGYSPSDLLYQRKIKSTLPMHWALLSTNTDKYVVQNKIEEKLQQAYYYNRNSKQLDEFSDNDDVVVYNFKTELWDIHGKVLKKIRQRTYQVRLSSGFLVTRNRKFLKKISYDPPQELPKLAVAAENLNSNTSNKSIQPSQVDKPIQPLMHHPSPAEKTVIVSVPDVDNEIRVVSPKKTPPDKKDSVYIQPIPAEGRTSARMRRPPNRYGFD